MCFYSTNIRLSICIVLQVANEIKFLKEAFYLKKVGGRYRNICPGTPGGPVAKNPPANAENMGSVPGLGRSHMPGSN